MKIQPNVGFQTYKTYAAELKNADFSAAKEKDGHSVSTQNTDTVAFSGSAAAQAEIGRVAVRVAGEVEELGSEARLAKLSESIAQGRYFVSSDDLASSILGKA